MEIPYLREIIYFFLGILIAYMGNHVIQIYFLRFQKRGLMPRVDIFRDTPFQENYFEKKDFVDEQRHFSDYQLRYIKRIGDRGIAINPAFKHIPMQKAQVQIQPLKHNELANLNLLVLNQINPA